MNVKKTSRCGAGFPVLEARKREAVCEEQAEMATERSGPIVLKDHYRADGDAGQDDI